MPAPTTATVRNLRLDGLFTLRSPLTHIGETRSTTAFLVQEPILQPGGDIEEVACYSGNAWRGQLRDLAAAYMLGKLGNVRVGIDAFHLLFSGGRIGGETVTDIARARQVRQMVPMVSLLGGGIGNQIVAGKMRVGNCYPLCREAVPALPRHLHDVAAARTYVGMTFEKSFSRRDDTRIDSLRQHIAEPSAAIGEGAERGRKKAGREPQPDQMRMTVELLAVGVQLHTRIDLMEVTDIELGCLVTAIHSFARSPHIGGQANRGHGLVDLSYRLIDMDSGEAVEFLSVEDGRSLLCPPAGAAKDAYDQHLRSIYDAMLGTSGAEIRGLLEAV